MGEVGEGDEDARGHAQQLRHQPVGSARRLQRLGQHGGIEGGIGVTRQLDLRVALHHRQPGGDRVAHPSRVQLQPAHVAAARAERRHQPAGPAPHVQHARSRRHGVGDDRKVGAQPRPIRGVRAQAHAVRKPAITRSSSGMGSRNASWPKGDDSSTKLVGAPAAFSAATTARLSLVG